MEFCQPCFLHNIELTFDLLSALCRSYVLKDAGDIIDMSINKLFIIFSALKLQVFTIPSKLQVVGTSLAFSQSGENNIPTWRKKEGTDDVRRRDFRTRI